MIKRTVLTIFSTIILSISIFSPVFAAPTSSGSTFKGNCNYILGLTSWDCGVDISNQESLTSGIITIAANVLVDLSVIAAYLVLGYVIYGGSQYMFSGGDVGKVATGKKTLTQAFIGLAIVMLSNVILNAIRIALGADFTGSAAGKTDPNTMITGAIQWVVGIAGIVCAIFVVYGGISYITSSGNPDKLKKAKSAILYALIGLAIVALAEVITAFVSNIIRDAGNSNTSITNNIIISKEIHENKIN